MSKLLDGYYKCENHFYKILKVLLLLLIYLFMYLYLIQVEGGKSECDDGSGIKYPMKIKYGDFGESNH